MSFLSETYNKLSEALKYGFYSRKEIEIQDAIDSTQTTLPHQEETAYANYDPFSAYTSSQFGQQNVWSANKNDMILKYRQASYLPEVDSAISDISNEAICYDEIEDTIKLNLADIELPDPIKNKITESFENILQLMDFNERGDELFKQWFVDGQLNFETCFDNNRIREGIKKLVLMTPFNLQTYIDTNTKQKKYYYGDLTPTTSYRNMMNEKSYLEEQVTHVNSGVWSMDRKFPISYLNPALKSINQLNLIEDSLVIYRITRSPEKLAFYIATGKLPKAQAESYINSIMTKYRQKRVYNTENGTLENKNRSISILENYFFPVAADGNSSRVETVAGSSPNFTSFEDVDYFLNKVYKALHVPLNRRAPDSRTTINTSVDIEKEEVRFFKFILKLRKRFNYLFIDLMKKDLLAKNVMSVEDWNLIKEKIKFTYSNSNEYSEIKSNQVMGMRIDGANGAIGLVDQGVISTKFVQEKILRLTEDEIEEIEIQNGDRKENEDMRDHNFGPDYDVSRRDRESEFEHDEIPELPKPPSPTTASVPEGPNVTTTPKPMSPTTGAVESISSTDNLLNERWKQMMSQLDDGDIITDGNLKFEMKNGKLIKC